MLKTLQFAKLVKVYRTALSGRWNLWHGDRDRHSVVQNKIIQLERRDRKGGGNVSTVKIFVTGSMTARQILDFSEGAVSYFMPWPQLAWKFSGFNIRGNDNNQFAD